MMFSHYLYRNNSKEELEAFRNQYEMIFDTFRSELIDETGTERYELLDDIYMLFDLYEPDKRIREQESFCIDETELIRRIKSIYESSLSHR